MKLYGAHRSRIAALVLTVMMLISTCLTPAYAGNIWDELILSVAWTDGRGQYHSVPASQVDNDGQISYWARLDSSALGQTLTVETISPDSAYSFYLLDDWGNQTSSFTWLPEMDALNTGYEFAHVLFYAVNGVQADMPILLYVSTIDEPREETFQPYPVQVRVNYVTESGDVLDTQYAECWAGETTPVWAGSGATAGYQLMGADRVDVTVDRDGNASPYEVTFVYREVATPTPIPTEVPTPTPVAEVSVPVVYLHVNGDQLDFQEIRLAPGDHVVYADSRKVEGYVPVGDTAVALTIFADGTTNIGSVVFYYEDAAPAEAWVSVYYVHENGQTLDFQEVRLPEGNHVITPDSSKVGGYELTGAERVNVTVRADGSAEPSYVQFTYKDVYVAPAQAQVTVNYYHIDRGMLDVQTLTLPVGTHTVRAESSKTGDYRLLGDPEVTVTVYEDGSVHPGTVEFYYQDIYTAPVTAQLTIRYQKNDGTLLATSAWTLEPGVHDIIPDAAMPDGYVLDGQQSHTVYVDESGAINPDTVTFTLRQAEVTITVRYQDDRGREVAPSQQVTLPGDGNYVIRANPEGLDAAYELAPGLHTEVNVSVYNGVPSQSDIYFYYQQKQSAPVSAAVTVRYFDTYGVEIAPAQNITLEIGSHRLTPDTARVPAGYELVSDAFINVEVYDNGTFAPQEIAFYYREAQPDLPTATITVHYRDDRGYDVAPSQTVTLPDGTHAIKAQPENLPEGYVIFAGTEDTVQVTVRNGQPSHSQVVFYYQKQKTEPSVFTLPVYYYDTLGNPVATTQYVQVGPGTYAIQANPADLPEGYELMMESVLSITVFQDGTTDPEEIAFYYRAPQKRATVIVSYVDERGSAIVQPFAVELAPGYHTIQADEARVPKGYDPASAKPVQVVVSPEGKASPDQVVLTFHKLVVETPIPIGQNVYRYARVNDKNVAFRSEPTTSGGNKTVIRRLNRNETAYVLKEVRNDKNEVWAQVIVNGKEGYMMSKFLDVMTQAESDAFSAGSTPAPTFTPVPTATAVPTWTPVPTATPTLEPTIPPLVEEITPTPVPTAVPTATPVPYTGYALTTRATALRSGISASEMTIIQRLEANELLSVMDQVADPVTGEVWAIVSTLAKQPGYVPFSALRTITDREAQPYLDYWEEMNKTPEPTQEVTPTPEPMQVQGYAVVLGDDVPFRQMQSEFSRIIDNLQGGTVVYVTGQTPGDGQYWHSVNYDGRWGYIRVDLLRMMTIAEEEAYLQAQQATPTPATTNLPFNEAGMSSYGYVDCSDNSSVNWRETPSTGGKKIGTLKRYAFCLVLDTEHVNGVTWYLVRYGDKTGYLHGDFFKQMTIAELEGFLGSEEYLQGIANNSASGESAKDDAGYTGTGGIVSAEDQWVNKYPDVYASFEPFNPIATVAPIATATPTLEPLPGWIAQPTATPSPSPTASPTFNPLPDIIYPSADEGEGGSALIWILVAGLLLLAVGGVFVMVRHQQNRRRMAMRAAQRRAQAARAQQQRPYARSANPNQPRTGAYANQARRPANDGFDSQYTTYTGDNGGSYFRTMDDAFTPEDPSDFVPKAENTPQTGNGRVGRRTAYRQAQRQNEDNSFDM